MMNNNLREHIVNLQANVRDALIKLDLLASDAILFLVDNKNHLIGSLTDGDIRRGLIKGLSLETPLKEFVQPNPSFIFEDEDVIMDLIGYYVLLKVALEREYLESYTNETTES